MKIRHALFAILTVALFSVGGCAKSCSCSRKTGDQTIGPDGNPVGLAALPGHKTGGELNVHAYDGGLPYLYGPFYVNRPALRQLRVINKIGQPINDAKIAIVAEPGSGDAQKESCTAEFMKEGIYQLRCLYDRPGDWDMKLEAVSGTEKGLLEYQVFVRPTSEEPVPAPAATPTPSATEAEANADSDSETGAETETDTD